MRYEFANSRLSLMLEGGLELSRRVEDAVRSAFGTAYRELSLDGRYSLYRIARMYATEECGRNDVGYAIKHIRAELRRSGETLSQYAVL